MLNQLTQTAKLQMEQAFKHLTEEFAHLQVGRANSALVEGVKVDSYGTLTPLKSLANIGTPDPVTISIQPWDRSIAGAIEKAILQANLGLTPHNDGGIIRINVPKPTEEKRKELLKTVSKLAEEARISVRNARHDAHSTLKKFKETGEATEDDFFKMDKELQKIVDEYNQKIEEISDKKSKDIMTI